MREPGTRVGRGIRGHDTRDRKVNRLPAPGTAMVADGFDKVGDDDDDRQGPSPREMAQMLGEMMI